MWVEIIIVVFAQVFFLIGIVQFLAEAVRAGTAVDTSWEVATRPKLLQVMATRPVRTNLQT